MSIYDFKVKDVKKNDVEMSDYKGKVLLIVNTASGCGFTPQYEGLSKLYDQYRDQGFEILDFPCNQFMNQAPGSDEELAGFCQLKYGTNFQTFAKVDVNGKNADPLFSWLKENTLNDEQGNEKQGFKGLFKKIAKNVTGNDVKWNFTKFLVDREGKVVARFAPTYKPEQIEEHIKNLL